jgi:hypothetical protein
MKKKNAGNIAGNNEPQNPSETIQVDNVSNKGGRKGRPKGMSVGERQKSYIEINPNYRIDISDGLNYTVQKYVTRTRIADGQSEDGSVNWKQGDTYTEWSNADAPFCSSARNAFRRLLDIMVIDKCKEKEKVSVEEFIKIYKDTDKWLNKKFENGLEK